MVLKKIHVIWQPWSTWNSLQHYATMVYTTRAGLVGATGAIAPDPDPRKPPWWHLFVSNNIFVWKIVVIQKRY